MLFRRKKTAQGNPVQALDTKTYNYQGDSYYVAQWPDSRRLVVSAHGETFHIYPKETEDNAPAVRSPRP